MMLSALVCAYVNYSMLYVMYQRYYRDSKIALACARRRYGRLQIQYVRARVALDNKWKWEGGAGGEKL
jgi:hypothetical protein